VPCFKKKLVYIKCGRRVQVATFGDSLFKEIPASKVDGTLTSFLRSKYAGAKYLWLLLARTKW